MASRLVSSITNLLKALPGSASFSSSSSDPFDGGVKAHLKQLVEPLQRIPSAASAIFLSSASSSQDAVLEDLEELGRLLPRIKAVLYDAGEREIRDESSKLWLKELKGIAYGIEDVLDVYHYEALRVQVEGRRASADSSLGKRKQRAEEEVLDFTPTTSLMTQLPVPNSMAGQIRRIMEGFREISEDRERLHLSEEEGERRVSGAAYPAPTSHMVDESSIYGREDDKKKVIDLLLSEDRRNGISVIPIVGKGGLGKTTIAQLVYNDSIVKKCFNLTGWVCVSDDFNVTRLTKVIIESITRRETPCGLTELSTLQDTLKEEVKGKRVLLVLDDVWNEQQSLWESLRIPFAGAEAVQIIVTCRNDSVAEIMQTVDPYRPSCLPQEKCWLLFKHYAFVGRDFGEQARLVGIGQKIMERCSGLPLAVKTIGSLLRHMRDEESWKDLLESDLWEMDRNNETLAALKLSYTRMPAHLKPCFVYCSMFPKDYEFDKDDIVRLWMAQGYIPSGGRRSMEDIGSEYFEDLQRRSFFDPYDRNFKMHDMVHDLARFVSGNECCAMVDAKLWPCGLPKEVCHLYVKREEELVRSVSSQKLSAIRTLVLKNYFYPSFQEEATQLPLLLRTAGCLRALHVCLEVPPDSFGDLKHLRYFSLQSTLIDCLPESICLLYHLQTLILSCPKLAKLPDGMGNLINLRCLIIDNASLKRLPGSICQLHNLRTLDLRGACLCYLPAVIGKLTNLPRLYGCFQGEKQGGIGVLKDLANLQGSLYISGLGNLANVENARDANLKNKHQLKKLALQWSEDKYFMRPGWVNDPEEAAIHLSLSIRLTKIKDVMVDEKMEEAMLEYLQPHSNLKSLCIKGYGGSKFPKWVGNPLSFKSLEEIYILDCDNIRSLPLYIHDFPGTWALKKVHIGACRQLTSIAGLCKVDSLKSLIIYNCPQLRLSLEEKGWISMLEEVEIDLKMKNHHAGRSYGGRSRLQQLQLNSLWMED